MNNDEILKDVESLEKYVLDKDEYYYSGNALRYSNCGYMAWYSIPDWEEIRNVLLTFYDLEFMTLDECISDAIHSYYIDSTG